MTDQRRTHPAKDLQDFIDQMTRRRSGPMPPALEEDPWADDKPMAPPAEASSPADQRPSATGEGVGRPTHRVLTRSSGNRLGRSSNVPTAAHARAAATLARGPTVPPHRTRAPTIPPQPTRPSSPSTPRIKLTPTHDSAPRIEHDARRPPSEGRVVTERPERDPSRWPVIVLSALVAGSIGALMVVKVMQYAENPPELTPAARMVATDPPAADPPAADPSAVDPPAVAPPAVEPPAAAPPPGPTVVASAFEPVVAPASDPPASPTRSVARAEPGKNLDKGSKIRARPSYAVKAVPRPRFQPEKPAEAIRSAPRTEARPAPEADKAELAKADAPRPEPPKSQALEAETSESPKSVARLDPPASAPRSGTIDVAATRAAVRTQIGPVQQCYERARMDDAALAGTVVARITVGSDGSVTRVEIVSSTLAAPSVEACIRQGMSRWHLPRPSGGASASLTYPLVFR